MENISVKRASFSDLNFIVDLQKKFTNQIGFIPKKATERELNIGNVILGDLNNENAGFLLFYPSLSCQKKTAIIVQAAIHFDAQRKQVGLNLLDELFSILRLKGQSILQATCLEDIEANFFWKAAGFTAIATKQGGERRNRNLIIWRKKLVEEADLSILPISRQPRGTKGRFVCKGREVVSKLIGSPLIDDSQRPKDSNVYSRVADEYRI